MALAKLFFDPQQKRVPSLDGLRAISIGLVLFGHLSGTRDCPWVLPEAFDLGNLGVRIFFVISGFLITHLLLREKAANGIISLESFYLRRVRRIVPASYVFILSMAGVAAVGGIRLRQQDLLSAFTYTANMYYGRSWDVGHLWSLAVEEQFYLLWPAILVFAGLRRALWVACAVVAAAPAFRLLLLFVWKSQLAGLPTLFPAAADALAVGCILAFVRDRLGSTRTYMALLRSRWFTLIVPVIVLLNFSFSTKVRHGLELTLLNVAIVLAIDWCIRFPGGRVGAFLNSTPMAIFGVLSYSIYLWQQPFLNRNSTFFLQSFPLNLVCALTAALASYLLVERPVLRWKLSKIEGSCHFAATPSRRAATALRPVPSSKLSDLQTTT